MASAIQVELDKHQNKPDEFAISYSHKETIALHSKFIYHIFKTSIEFGDLVKNTVNTPTKDMKQWVYLYGREEDRAKTRKYIYSLCQPDFTQKMASVSQDLIKRLESDNYKNELINNYQVHLYILKQNNDTSLIIQGSLSDVSEVKCILDLENNKLNTSAKKLKTLTCDNIAAADDDVIWIADPYEQFDALSTFKNNKPDESEVKKTNSYSTVDLIEIDMENSFNEKLSLEKEKVGNKPNVTSSSLSSSILISPTYLSLSQLALSKGYTKEEIDKAFSELKTSNIGEFEFIQYLKATSNLRKKPIDHKQSIIQTQEPAKKKQNISNTPDCLILDYIPNKVIQQAKAPAMIQRSSLSDYANMVETQKFDEENEKSNKAKRITKLISAMPDNQKQDALNQVNKYKIQINNANTEIFPSDKANAENKKAQQSAKQTNNEKDKFNNSSSIQVYNPTIYQDDDFESAGFMFDGATNFQQKQHPIPQMTNLSNQNNNNNNRNNRRNNFKSVDRNTGFKSKRSKSSNPRNNLLNNFSEELKNPFMNHFQNQQKSNQQQYQASNYFQMAKLNEPVKNMYNSNPNLNNFNQMNINLNSDNKNTSDLKFIIIDASNVAREHGNAIGKSIFSCRGIEIVVNYFLQRGHKDIKAFLPRFRRGNSDHNCPTVNPEILDKLEERGYLTYTPSRHVNNKLIIPYDDRFILKAALHYDAIIVSNDNYRDLMQENAEWKRLVEKNLLQYSFVGDLFMVADDPLGRRGPNLNEFLSNKSNKQNKSKNKSSSILVSKENNASNSQLYSSNSLMNDTNFLTNNNINSVSSNDKRIRTVAQSSDIQRRLIEIFPNAKNSVSKLLNSNPAEIDINFFITKLLDADH